MFTCAFETETGYLRPVKVGKIEVLRAVYGAVRDKNWETALCQFEVDELEQGENGFSLEFTARYDGRAIPFSWKGVIKGQGGSLEFRFEGCARAPFLRNRIGLCVLHPIKECAGEPCQIQEGEGRWRKGVFPLYISPHQPFKNLRMLRWSPSSGLDAEIRFEGDVFEMEDQRNWTDASFKTYSTPLELPFPVEVAAGEQISQRVVLSLTSPERVRVSAEDEPKIKLTRPVGSDTKHLPKIGVGVASHGVPLSIKERQRFARLRLNHLRVDLSFSQSSWKNTLRKAHDEAGGIGAKLQCALFLSDAVERSLLDFSDLLSPEAVDRCLIFHETEKTTSARWFELAERTLGSRGFHLATGTNAYFAELNRQRPPRNTVACFSLNPQVHAFDDRSMVESLEAQPATVGSALQFCDHEVIISPVTLRPRFNPNATDLAPECGTQLPLTADLRQRTLFGAAWTLGTLSKLLPLERVESLTFYETTGGQGLMEMEGGFPNPRFGSAPGEIFPVYYIFEALAGASQLLPVIVSDPGRVAALAFSGGLGGTTCLLANLTGRMQKVELGPLAVGAQILGIDETNLSIAREGEGAAWHLRLPAHDQASLSLGPNALIKLEFS